MTQLRFLPAPLTASAALLLALMAPGRALANDCASSTDCDQGFECQVVGTSGCATPSCPPDAPCPEAEPCEVRTQMECVPAACTSDAECGAGMVCHEWMTGSCGASDCACSSDQPDCTCAAAPACEETTERLCTPKYVLPCAVAADCGSNFTCEEQQSCGCSGSTGSGAEPTPDDAARPLPPEGDPQDPQPEPNPDCSCEASGQFACVPVEIDCDSDSNCPSGWRCQLQGIATDPGCAGGDCEAAPIPQPEPTTGRCFPSYYGGVGVDLDGGTATSGGDDKGTPNGDPQNPEAAPSGESAQDSSESAACQLGHAPASHSVLSILAVLGAVLGLSRRRAEARAGARPVR
jgi:hypothetical protein